MVHTLQPVTYSVLSLVQKVQAKEMAGEQLQTSTKKTLQFVHKTIDALKKCCQDAEMSPDLPFRLWLNAAKVANNADMKQPGAYEPICVEFITQALIVFEEDMSDSKTQAVAITAFVGALQEITCLEQENMANFCTKAVQYAAKLLKKTDQCRMIILASSVFYGQTH